MRRRHKMRSIIIFSVLMLSLGSVCVFCSAETVIDESQYIKDTVPVENTYACQIGNVSACEVPILLGKADKKVTYYWSAAENKWIDAGDQGPALQSLYDSRKEIRNKRQLKAMQDEMTRRTRESMDEAQRETPEHR